MYKPLLMHSTAVSGITTISVASDIASGAITTTTGNNSSTSGNITNKEWNEIKQQWIMTNSRVHWNENSNNTSSRKICMGLN